MDHSGRQTADATDCSTSAHARPGGAAAPPPPPQQQVLLVVTVGARGGVGNRRQGLRRLGGSSTQALLPSSDTAAGPQCRAPAAACPGPTPVFNSFARNFAAASLLMITQGLFRDGSQWCSNTTLQARAHIRALPGPLAGVTVTVTQRLAPEPFSPLAARPEKHDPRDRIIINNVFNQSNMPVTDSPLAVSPTAAPRPARARRI